MEWAFCILDEQNYEALPFSEMPPDRIEALRYDLLCCECRQPAFYRGRARDGRAPCFGARHADGCEQAAAGGDGWGDGAEGEREEIPNEGQPVRIDLARGAPERPVAGAAPGAVQAGRGRRFAGGEGANVARPTRRLRSLLRALLEDNLAQSTRLFEPPEQPAIRACDFFVSTAEARERGVGMFRGRWGRVLNVGRTEGVIWFNTGGRDSLSFMLPEEQLPALLAVFHVAEENDLIGADILVLGSAEVAASGKLYARILSTNHVALRLNR